MNKSMLTGMALGIGFAAAGGVAGYQLLGAPEPDEHGSDRDLTTAVGAAVGAFAGNKIQQRIQERNSTTTTEVRCAPAR